MSIKIKDIKYHLLFSQQDLDVAVQHGSDDYFEWKNSPFVNFPDKYKGSIYRRAYLLGYVSKMFSEREEGDFIINIECPEIFSKDEINDVLEFLLEVGALKHKTVH